MVNRFDGMARMLYSLFWDFLVDSCSKNEWWETSARIQIQMKLIMFHIHALHVIKYLQQTMSSKKQSMFFWLSLYTSDNFPIFLPPSLPFCNVLNTFMLFMCSFLALLFGACGRGCNSQLNWNHLVNHAHLHPTSLMPAVQKARLTNHSRPIVVDAPLGHCLRLVFSSLLLRLISSPAPAMLPSIWLTSLEFLFSVSQQFTCNCVHKHAEAMSPQVILIVVTGLLCRLWTCKYVHVCEQVP